MNLIAFPKAPVCVAQNLSFDPFVKKKKKKKKEKKIQCTKNIKNILGFALKKEEGINSANKAT